MPSPLTEYDPEWETFEAEAPAWLGESSYEVLGESDELELATELLAVTDEHELDQFLGNLIGTIARTVGKAVQSPLGQAIGRGLKGVIRQTLPLAGTALGTIGRRPARRIDRQRARKRCGPRARPRARGPEPRGPGARSDQAVRPLRRRRGQERGVGALFRRSGGDRRFGDRRGRAQRRAGAAAIPAFSAPAPQRAGHSYPTCGGHSMHDIDRTQLESDYEGESYEFEQSGWTGEGEVFGEAEEMELASELMEVRDEQELDQFLSTLIKKAGRALGRLVGSPDGQAIGSILKGAAKQLLPHAAGAVGAAFGGPLGARISSGIASLVDGEMGHGGGRLEPGGLRPGGLEPGRMESGSLESGRLEPGGQRVRRRQAVRAGRRRHRAERDGRVGHDGSDVGRAERDRAGGRAAGRPDCCSRSRYGMAPYSGQYPGAYSGGESGRWMRRGNRIVLFGV